MQISIEQHDAVTAGLGTELCILRDRISALQADLEAARTAIKAQDEAGQQIANQAVKQARQLHLIEEVALGWYSDRIPTDDPDWTPALAKVEDVVAEFRKKVGELEMVLAAKATRKRK